MILWIKYLFGKALSCTFCSGTGIDPYEPGYVAIDATYCDIPCRECNGNKYILKEKYE